MSNKYDPPQTRVEAILLNMLGESYKLDPPQTRVELLLQAILEQGGGGGTEPVIKYKGVTTTPLTDGSTTNPVEIDGEEVTAETGDFVAYNGAEFIWNGTAWQELGDLELVAAIMTSIAPTYSEAETYNAGDKVYYNDVFYECLDNNVTGAFAPSKWTQISVVQILSEIETSVDQVSADTQSVMSMISDTYKTTSTYNVGDLVIRNKVLFSCTANNTTGTWDASKWSETDIATVLKSIRSSIDSLITALANLIDDTTTASDKVWSSSKTDSEIVRDLSDLDDVEITSPTDGQALLYDETDDKWKNQTLPDPSVTKTATGNPIELTDAASAPLVKCVTEIQGSQDLHGYDKPWVGGAGKNKLPMTVSGIKAINTSGTWSGNTYTWNGATFSIITDNDENIIGININGTASALTYLLIQNQTNDFSVFADKSCVLSGCPANGSTSTYTLSTYGAGMITNDVGNGVNVTFPSTAPNAWNIAINIISGYTASNLLFKPMIRLSTESDSTFAPYSNICPITAYTEGEIEVRGKNALDTSTVTIRGITFTQDSNGYVSASPNNSDPGAWRYSNSQYKTSLYPGSYSLIVEVKTVSTNVNADAKIFDSDNNTILSLAPIVAFASLGIKRFDFTIENKLDIGVMFKQYDAVARFMVIKSTDSSTYEPYTSTTHTTTYPSAIYRGSEDCVEGEVDADKIKLTIASDIQLYGPFGTDNALLFYYDPSVNIGTYSRSTHPEDNKLISNFYKAITSENENDMPDFEIRTNNNAQMVSNRIYIRDSRFETALAFNQYIANNPIEVVVKLATPTTSSVTPTNLPIKSLSGYTHIESTTGDMDVEYITEGEQPLIDLLENYADNAAEEAASSMISDAESSSTKTWSSNKISSEISSGDTSIRNNIASTYDPTKTYNVGNIVYQNNTLYRCFVDNTTGTWNATRWRETTVAELIETLSAQPTSWDDVQALVRSGVAPQIFQIGDQLICQRDGVNIVWDVLAHNQDVPTDPTLTRSMTLGMHNIYTMMMFDNKEAAFTTESGLTAGTYNFTVGQHPWVSADVGKTYQFTLTKDVPANGQIVFNNAYTATFNNATVSTYSDGTSTTAIESATMTEGSSGTSLGTINNAGTPASGINSIQRALLGSNNYKESAIRQWLNSDQVAGSVWTPQTKFDRPPNWRNSSKGFMNGLDADFKAVIGEITFNTARNTVSDGGGYDTMSDKFRLLARENVYAGKEVSTVDEGGVYDYYSKYSSCSSASTGADTNRIKRYNNSPNWWWLRSPNSGDAIYARSIGSDGSLHTYGAVGGIGVVVACNIV